MTKLFAEMTPEEQNALRDAHEAGRTIELFNPNMGRWIDTYRPSFEPDLAYRIAAEQAPPIPDLQRG